MHTRLPTREHLEAILHTQIHSMAPISLPHGGSHSRAFLIETAADDYVLRVPKGRQGFYTAYLPTSTDLDNWLDQVWAISLARRLGVPAPEIVHSDRERRFVITRRLPGEYVADYEEWDGCPYDEAEFGSILARMHSVSLDGYGPVDDYGNTYFNAWPAFLTAVAQKVLAACSLRKSIDDQLHTRLRERWLPRLSGLGDKRAALLHLESLGFANILYDPASRRITGFLDYEDCVGGDPLFELTWMCYYYGERESGQTYFDYERFELGYGPWPSDGSASALYKPFTYLEKLAWIDPTGGRADNHREKLSSICSRL